MESGLRNVPSISSNMTENIGLSTADNMDQTKPKKDVAEKMVVHLFLGFREICLITAALPLLTLLLCFIFAVVFQAEEVHETHCKVFNIIPSISAITGISPQRYFWRISIALHIGPRFLIAACYRNHYTNLLREQIVTHSTNPHHRTANFLVQLVFALHVIEVSALCGVTYVSNRENYPIHEKIFVTFMICSLLHMLATIILQRYLHPDGIPPPGRATTSLIWKKRLFILSILSTLGLMLFFMKHRFYCHDLAFSWFALCEYIIACSNLAFHCTTIWDFPSEHLVIAQGMDKFKRN